jgi:hypothetical protein
MALANIQRIALLGILAAIFILAWKIQQHMLLNWDVSWLIHASSRWFAGGSYSQDFFDPDPPMILYLSLPVSLIAKQFSLSLTETFRGYLFCLCAISLLSCHQLLKSIFSVKDKLVSRFFLATIAFVFLLIPTYELGQRENLLLILMMPYLLCAHLRIENKNINRYFGIFIGLFAAFGFALKPYFIITFILLEIYVILRTKSILALVRSETLTIISILAIYAASLFIFYPDYLFIIIPYASRHYAGFNDSLKTLLTYPPAIYCFFSLLFYLALKNFNSYKSLLTVLAIALIGLLISFYLQHAIFYYRIIPAFSIAILLLSLIFCLCIANTQQPWVRISLLTAALCGFLFYYCSDLWTILVFSPFTFFGFFAVLFAVLLFSQKLAIIRVFCSLLIILGINIYFSYMTQHTVWFYHQTLLTLILLSLLFTLVLPKKRLQYFFLMIMGSVLFSYPIYLINVDYRSSLLRKEKILVLGEFIKEHANNKPIYFFSTTPSYLFPIIDDTGATSASRFPFFWSLPGLIKQTQNHISPQQTQDKNLLIQMIVDDFARNKPEFVFVDVKQRKAHLNNINFDYLENFSQDPAFKKIWQNYIYFTSLQNEEYYQFQVFKLKPRSSP